VILPLERSIFIKEFRINRIAQISVVKRVYMLGKMIPQLKIIMKDGRGPFFVAVNRPEEWLQEMAKAAGMKMEKK